MCSMQSCASLCRSTIKYVIQARLHFNKSSGAVNRAVMSALAGIELLYKTKYVKMQVCSQIITHLVKYLLV